MTTEINVASTANEEVLGCEGTYAVTGKGGIITAIVFPLFSMPRYVITTVNADGKESYKSVDYPMVEVGERKVSRILPPPAPINLGDEVKDTITPYTGVVTHIVLHLTGCRRYEVESRELHDGIPVGPVVFDEARLVVTKPKEIEVNPQNTGGPRDDSHLMY